ncbi:hypothetical protein BV25DRAFT_1357244 [Artomyces pyxidatus]|uniref:Uncharacterized protein n=1 Tax=Artomyces pyxidatus TaxID=48021 RepID=A0ACB8SP26_9AGAM|nr:hypothetical protein BV25DRAFT_1357244 [Artomyces pyxidatus]
MYSLFGPFNDTCMFLVYGGVRRSNVARDLLCPSTMFDSSDAPALFSSAVFYITSSVSIRAPPKNVWDVLLDFPSYSEWNPYIRTQVPLDEAGQPLLGRAPERGVHIRLAMHIPPTMDDSAKPSQAEEILTHVDHENLRLAWRFATPARWLMHAERWQILRGAGEQTTYETWEVFGGLLAYPISFFMKGKLQAAFDAMAEALKARAEESERIEF